MAEAAAAKHNLQITGAETVQLDFISGNGRDEYPKEWKRMYDFTRTVDVTLRLMMLKATGLIELHDPNISEPARGRNDTQLQFLPRARGCNRPINYKNHLATNEYEARWFTAHFDMLFPHFYLESQLAEIAIGQRRHYQTMN